MRIRKKGTTLGGEDKETPVQLVEVQYDPGCMKAPVTTTKNPRGCQPPNALFVQDKGDTGVSSTCGYYFDFLMEEMKFGIIY